MELLPHRPIRQRMDSGSFDVSRVIGAGFLLWSLATAATRLVRGFTMLLAMRLMLGIGESVMAPADSKILGFNLPEHHRGFANGVLQAAVRSGPAPLSRQSST